MRKTDTLWYFFTEYHPISYPITSVTHPWRFFRSTFTPNYCTILSLFVLLSTSPWKFEILGKQKWLFPFSNASEKLFSYTDKIDSRLSAMFLIGVLARTRNAQILVFQSLLPSCSSFKLERRWKRALAVTFLNNLITYTVSFILSVQELHTEKWSTIFWNRWRREKIWTLFDTVFTTICQVRRILSLGELPI